MNSLVATAWPACTDGLPGFKPSSKANGSSIKVSTFVSQFDELEDSDSVGCQVAMKSPPGPNLQRGSAFISTSALALLLVFYNGTADHYWHVFLIGAASGITQTKTEQKLRISTLFSDASFSLMMPATISDGNRSAPIAGAPATPRVRDGTIDAGRIRAG